VAAGEANRAEQDDESKDERPIIDRTRKNSLRSSMVYSFYVVPGWLYRILGIAKAKDIAGKLKMPSIAKMVVTLRLLGQLVAVFIELSPSR
jgi:hypothetical protein